MRFSLLFALAFVAAPALASVGTQSSDKGMIKKRLVEGAGKYTGSSGKPDDQLINAKLLDNLSANIASVVGKQKRDEEVEKRSSPIINVDAANDLKANVLSYVKPHKRSTPEPEKRSPGQGEIINIQALQEPDINLLSKVQKAHKRSIVDVDALNDANINVASVVHK